MSVLELIDPKFAASFASQAKGEGFNHVEEKTLHVSRAWAVTDHPGGAGQDQGFEVFANTSGSLVEQTQNPKMSSNANLPTELRIALCAVSCIVRLGKLDTIAHAQTIQDGLDRSVLTLKLGGLEHLQFEGPEFMDYGPPLLIGNDGTGTAGGAAAAQIGRLTNGPRTYRKFALPRLPGVQQQMSLMHSVGVTADWPATFTADYAFPSLIARKSV